MASFLQELLKPIPATIWLAVGAVAAHLWRRYRGRMVTLRWDARHQGIAFSAEDARFGKIEVLYNGVPVQNVYMTFVRVENESTKDLSDVDLNLVYADGSTIQVATGVVLGSANVLPLAPSFIEHVNQLGRIKPQDPKHSALLAYLTTRRDFRVPVLNRDSSLDIALLVQAPQGKMPFINVSCDYPGVRMVARAPRQLLFGVDHQRAALTGFVVGLVAVLAVSTNVPSPTPLALGSFLLGACGSLVGVGIIQALRLIRRLLS